MKVITQVRGEVPQIRQAEFEAEYRNAKNEALPEGLEMSVLIRKSGGSGVYTIQTIWSSMEALQAMRRGQKPKAIALFEQVGVAPTVEIHEVIGMLP